VLRMKKAVLSLGWSCAPVLMALANSSQKRVSTLSCCAVFAGFGAPSMGPNPVGRGELLLMEDELLPIEDELESASRMLL